MVPHQSVNIWALSFVFGADPVRVRSVVKRSVVRKPSVPVPTAVWLFGSAFGVEFAQEGLKEYTFAQIVNVAKGEW